MKHITLFAATAIAGLFAWTSTASAQPSPAAVECRATETQAECHTRLKCRASEDVEVCQRRLLRCRANENAEDCKRRAASEAAARDGQRDDGGRGANDRGRDDNRASDRGRDDRASDRGRSDRDNQRGRRADDRDSSRGSRRGGRGRGRGGGGSGGGGGGGGGGGYETGKTFGLGLELGTPSGLNGKYFLSDVGALDFGVGWIYRHYYYGDGLHLYADYLHHVTSLVSTDSFELPFYFGVGARFWDFDYCVNRVCTYGGSAIGIRVPIGIAFDFRNAPVDIFLQLVPVVDFLRGDYYNRYRDRTHVGIDFSAGIRFWFK